MDNNFNLDQNTINKLNDIVKNGDVSNLISQIPPDVMQNFSSLMNGNNQNQSQTNNNMNNNDKNHYDNKIDDNNNVKSNNNSFDFSNIDMNTIMKMKSIMEKMNNTNDPRSNLLSSLKPYLRNSKKEKLDQYANFINFAKIAEILKNDNKEPK